MGFARAYWLKRAAILGDSHVAQIFTAHVNRPLGVNHLGAGATRKEIQLRKPKPAVANHNQLLRP